MALDAPEFVARPGAALAGQPSLAGRRRLVLPARGVARCSGRRFAACSSCPRASPRCAAASARSSPPIRRRRTTSSRRALPLVLRPRHFRANAEDVVAARSRTSRRCRRATATIRAPTGDRHRRSRRRRLRPHPFGRLRARHSRRDADDAARRRPFAPFRRSGADRRDDPRGGGAGADARDRGGLRPQKRQPRSILASACARSALRPAAEKNRSYSKKRVAEGAVADRAGRARRALLHWRRPQIRGDR